MIDERKPTPPEKLAAWKREAAASRLQWERRRSIRKALEAVRQESGAPEVVAAIQGAVERLQPNPIHTKRLLPRVIYKPDYPGGEGWVEARDRAEHDKLFDPDGNPRKQDPEAR